MVCLNEVDIELPFLISLSYDLLSVLLITGGDTSPQIT